MLDPQKRYKIPLKIETLLEGRVVEHDRVECKTGWNPNDIIHFISAFANECQWKIEGGRTGILKWHGNDRAIKRIYEYAKIVQTIGEKL